MITTKDGPRFVDEAPAQSAPARPLRRLRSWLRRVWDRNRLPIAIALLLLLFMTVFFWRSMFVRIGPGQAGVKWSRVGGTVLERVYLEGTAVIPPWDEMFVYDVRVQERTDSIVLLTANGLALQVRMSSRYQPVLQQLPQLHQKYGPEYSAKVVLPEIVAAMRRVIGQYTPDQIYAKDEYALLDEINTLVRNEIDNRYLIVEEVLIQSLRLPDELQQAIARKLTQEQAFLEYEFRLAREEAEAQRKAVEAQGLADFARIAGVSPLQWRGLDVTEQLAKSPNSKLILIPSGSNELPIILNPGN